MNSIELNSKFNIFPLTKNKSLSCFTSPMKSKHSSQISRISVTKNTSSTLNSSRPFTSTIKDSDNMNLKQSSESIFLSKATRNIEKYLTRTTMRNKSLDKAMSYLSRSNSKNSIYTPVETTNKSVVQTRAEKINCICSNIKEKYVQKTRNEVSLKIRSIERLRERSKELKTITLNNINENKTINRQQTTYFEETKNVEKKMKLIQSYSRPLEIELPVLKKEVDEMKGVIIENNTEKIKLLSDVKSLINENYLLQEEIKRTNFSIGDITKSKEDIKSSIVVLKKHIKALKNKILSLEYKDDVNMYDIENLEKKFLTKRTNSCKMRKTSFF